MTDTPIYPPHGKVRALAWFIGETARPLSILIACFCAGLSSVVLATKVKDGNDGYLLAGAIWLGAGALFVGKAVEVYQNHRATARADATVKVAEATGQAPEIK